MAAKKDPRDVTEFSVAEQDTTHAVLAVNGEEFRFDAQQFLELRKVAAGVALNLKY